MASVRLHHWVLDHRTDMLSDKRVGGAQALGVYSLKI
jgi:hypothetical protein